MSWPVAELAALAAALCWAIGGLISVGVVRRIGAVLYNRLRMLIVGALLALVAGVSGGWLQISSDMLWPLVVSGLIGIFIGDTALFASLQRLGPRRAAVIFSANAPLTALLAALFLDERLDSMDLWGGALVLAGVIVAIWARREASITAHHWEHVQGTMLAGVALGLLSASCQAIGALIAKPAMEAGADPVAASALRTGVAAVALSLVAVFRGQPLVPTHARQRTVLVPTAQSGLIGMGLGMSLLLFALGRGDAGVVAVLSSTSPVLILPLIWLVTGNRPSGAAWSGGLLASVGTGLILA
jgi:drug/metabolite transporter (DMT)-like permease